MVLEEPEVRRLLHDLCVRLGFCLSPDDQLQLLAEPPGDPDAFTDAVFKAEGWVDPDRQIFRQVQTIVTDAFRRADDPDS